MRSSLPETGIRTARFAVRDPHLASPDAVDGTAAHGKAPPPGIKE